MASLAEPTPQAAPLPLQRRWARPFWLALGLLLVAIGLVGLVVPLLPTTDFLLLALPCLARGSPRVERWVLQHRLIGPPLHAWREQRAISRRGKRAALLGMSLGYATLAFTVHPRPMVLVPLALAMGAAGLWIATRKTPAPPPVP
jgi:uncharacterized membrane protein YbaN (DUF454 family)